MAEWTAKSWRRRHGFTLGQVARLRRVSLTVQKRFEDEGGVYCDLDVVLMAALLEHPYSEAGEVSREATQSLALTSVRFLKPRVMHRLRN
jgi:hypothetical protein